MKIEHVRSVSGVVAALSHTVVMLPHEVHTFIIWAWLPVSEKPEAKCYGTVGTLAAGLEDDGLFGHFYFRDDGDFILGELWRTTPSAFYFCTWNIGSGFNGTDLHIII